MVILKPLEKVLQVGTRLKVYTYTSLRRSVNPIPDDIEACILWGRFDLIQQIIELRIKVIVLLSVMHNLIIL